MSRFAIKRHVARETLAQLERIGLVERRRNIGACVRSLTPREVRELYQLRDLLETEAARCIELPVTAERLAPLVTTQQLHDDAVKAGDARAVFRANLHFHRLLFELADNATLVLAIAEYARQTHVVRFLSLLSQSGVTVDELVRASGLPASDVQARLADLEIDGQVVRLAGGKVARTA